MYAQTHKHTRTHAHPSLEVVASGLCRAAPRRAAPCLSVCFSAARRGFCRSEGMVVATMMSIRHYASACPSASTYCRRGRPHAHGSSISSGATRWSDTRRRCMRARSQRAPLGVRVIRGVDRLRPQRAEEFGVVESPSCRRRAAAVGLRALPPVAEAAVAAAPVLGPVLSLSTLLFIVRIGALTSAPLRGWPVRSWPEDEVTCTSAAELEHAFNRNSSNS